MPSLNPQQREAVESIHGPLLVFAGAGTGKTRVVTERISRMLSLGISAENILGVTFTNKAAKEMKSRLARLRGKNSAKGELVISTFHSLGARILRKHAHLLGYGSDFSICDQGEQTSIVRKISSTIRTGTKVPPEDLLTSIGRMKNSGFSFRQAATAAVEDSEQTIASCYRRYQEALKRLNAVDFDDLLLMSRELLSEFPEARDYWSGRFRYILVDEFQDTNQVQFDILRLLAAPENNLCVVGDDDQSIYAWRGAKVGNILRFNDHFPSARTVILEENYRSTSAILGAANTVIAKNIGRREKNLRSALGAGRPVRLLAMNDQIEEAARIAAEIKREAGKSSPLGDYAVIVRANAQARPFEEEFRAARIPYEIIGGQSFYEQKEVRDVMSYLAVAAGGKNDAHLLRIVNSPPRGIGDQTVDVVSAFARKNHLTIEQGLAKAAEIEGLTAACRRSCLNFANQIGKWRTRLRTGGLNGLVKEILTDVGYEEEAKSMSSDPLAAAARWNDALSVGDSLTDFAAGKGGNPIEALFEFLQESMLVGRDEPKPANKESVRIITAHSAKGLEFPNVYVVGLEEGLFPHKNALENDEVDEERRLFYVALTRAQRNLCITWCRKRLARGKPLERQPSRFLAELPDGLEREESPLPVEETKAWLAEMRGGRNSAGA